MDNFQEQFNEAIKNYATTNQYNVSLIPLHVHNGMDTSKITVVDLPAGTVIRLGLGAIGSFNVNPNVPSGDPTEQILTAIASGKSQTGTIDITTDNMQINLEHYPNDRNHFSFFDGYRPPILFTPPNTTISVTTGGNTMAVSNYGMTYRLFPKCFN